MTRPANLNFEKLVKLAKWFANLAMGCEFSKVVCEIRKVVCEIRNVVCEFRNAKFR